MTWATDHTLVNLAGPGLVRYDLVSGERSWEWRPPDDGCVYSVDGTFESDDVWWSGQTP